jgi:hypothetical protein
MAFDFLKLPKDSQRAAFAHMSKTGKATSAAKATTPKKSTSGGARKKMAAAKPKPSPVTSPVTNPKPGGGFETVGRISREDAAVIMFGRAGAAARIAKANAKRRRK